MFRRLFQKKPEAPEVPRNPIRVIVYDINGVLDLAGSTKDLFATGMTGRPNKTLLKHVNKLHEMGMPQYCATNMTYSSAISFYGNHKDVFQGLFTSDYQGIDDAKKDDPRYFAVVFEKLKEEYPDLQPKEVLFLDDWIDHIEQARKAGWRTEHVTSQLETEEALQKMFDRYTLVPNKGLEQGAP